jgi:NADH-quinone oxidoreductase subunit K
MYQNVPIEWYLMLSAVMFTLGVIGVITRRNAIIIFMSIEMMLNAVNLSFVAFAQYLGNTTGQIFVFFIMAVAAAEAAIGLAIALSLFRSKQTIYVDEVNIMKW